MTSKAFSINFNLGKRKIRIRWVYLLIIFLIGLFFQKTVFDLNDHFIDLIYYSLIGIAIGLGFAVYGKENPASKKIEKDKEPTMTSEAEKLLIQREEELKKINQELEEKIREIENNKKSLLLALEEVKRTGVTLEGERNKTLAVVSSFVTPILVLDKSGKLILFNPAATRSLGLRFLDYGCRIDSLDTYSLKNFSEIIRKEHKFNVITNEDKANGVILIEEIDIKHETGEDQMFKVFTTAVNDRNGEPMGIMKIFYDLTRERVLDKLKSEFISVAAHQLRTPLAAIKWIFEMVLAGDTGPINEDQKKFLSKGHESNERIIALVNDLLNISRIEEGRFGYSFDDVNFYELLDSVVEYFAKSISQNKITINVSKDDSIKLMHIDKERISMVLQNVLENAVKYSPKAGKIEVVCKKKDTFLEVSIADNGVGIPEADKSKLFSKFFRAGNVVRLQTEGSGLGLFIVKNIVEKHGGQISVESEEGVGTTIRFTLPLA